MTSETLRLWLNQADLDAVKRQDEARSAVFEWLEVFYVRSVQPKLV